MNGKARSFIEFITIEFCKTMFIFPMNYISSYNHRHTMSFLKLKKTPRKSTNLETKRMLGKDSFAQDKIYTFFLVSQSNY